MSDGYWLVTAKGAVQAVGAAQHYGDLSGHEVSVPIVGIAPSALLFGEEVTSGRGYWLAGADGSVYAFGDAVFSGRAENLPLSGPIVGIEAPPYESPGEGSRSYWLAGADGQVYTFGNTAAFRAEPSDPTPVDVVSAKLAESARSGHVPTVNGGRSTAAVVDIAQSFNGYFWLLREDGAVQPFGDAPYFGDATGDRDAKAVAMIHAINGRGYWIIFEDGVVVPFGSAALRQDVPRRGTSTVGASN